MPRIRQILVLLVIGLFLASASACQTTGGKKAGGGAKLSNIIK